MSNSTFGVCVAVFNAIASIICVSFTMLSIYYLCMRHAEDTKIRRSTMLLSILCMLFFSITCFIQIATSYFGPNSDEFIQKVCTGLGNAGWVLSQTCHYWVFINRLYYTFEGTKYEISKFIMRVFYILIALFIVNHACIGLVYSLDKYDQLYGDRKAAIGYVIVYSLIEILDVIICIFTLYLFSTKLIKLIQDFTDDNVENDNRSRGHTQSQSVNSIHSTTVDSNYALQFNHVQRFMVRIMTQYFVLILFGIVTTQMFLIVRVTAEICLIVHNHLYVQVYSYSLLFQSFQCIVNAGGIFLIFEFSKQYYELFCGKFHVYFKLMIKSHARKKAITNMQTNYVKL
eukprot:418657_1